MTREELINEIDALRSQLNKQSLHYQAQLAKMQNKLDDAISTASKYVDKYGSIKLEE